MAHGFDESTHVMESGLLRTLTDKSARQTAELDLVVDAPAATEAKPEPAAAPVAAPKPVAAPPSGRSRLFVVAGVVAAIALTFDAWLIVHHRPPTTPPVAAPATASNELPSYRLLPLGTPPPPAARPAAATPAAAPANAAIAEAMVVVAAAPTAHRHRHGHRRHATP